MREVLVLVARGWMYTGCILFSFSFSSLIIVFPGYFRQIMLVRCGYFYVDFFW